jgi:hypothetical protein
MLIETSRNLAARTVTKMRYLPLWCWKTMKGGRNQFVVKLISGEILKFYLMMLSVANITE